MTFAAIIFSSYRMIGKCCRMKLSVGLQIIGNHTTFLLTSAVYSSSQQKFDYLTFTLQK